MDDYEAYVKARIEQLRASARVNKLYDRMRGEFRALELEVNRRMDPSVAEQLARLTPEQIAADVWGGELWLKIFGAKLREESP